MSWSNKFLDIPFKAHGRDRNGCDCYGLLVMVYRDELGIVLQDYSQEYQPDQTNNGPKIGGLISQNTGSDWESIKDPRQFDGVILRIFGYPMHCGIMIDSLRMLHILEGQTSCIVDLTRPNWAKRVIDYVRYKKA